MIAAGFTGQLKGWWDNYIGHKQSHIYEHIKQEGDKQVSDAVYTLILTIIEHFTGRWSENSETIRTLLNGLRCPTLTSFKWYKDVFLSRVYELSENNSSHWKSKFIDGLPSLFAERVRKVLRGTNIQIPYDNYTYGRLIGVCVQEGLALCNELKLNQQIKKQNRTEKRQLGQFCEQFGMGCTREKDNEKSYKKS
ncbi:hypothetical protein HanHA300_Chr00c0038g0686551 [Helianthus annuus]|nr:hypothetical protein HanHA300_Chr00c0038g0686551 [Helianthus annuus]KAJ0756649.1 hypothetical protein HanLR1_Chr04g0129511 [Helianthus annuus]KAJ0760396.1 hypothetical protein HanOQP8_Chr04g0137521 [Helianthus annuus]